LFALPGLNSELCWGRRIRTPAGRTRICRFVDQISGQGHQGIICFRGRIKSADGAEPGVVPKNYGLSRKTVAMTASAFLISLKEVIQPHLPVRLPCYDFTPLASLSVGVAFLAVRQTTSARTNSGGVTGGVYKARERIHRGMLIRDY